MAAQPPTAAGTATRPPIALVFALAAENKGLRAALDQHPESPIVSMQSGPGAERAAKAARSLAGSGACALISWGLAGGLAPEAFPGTVLIPKRIVGLDGQKIAMDADWRACLLEALRGEFRCHEGDILSTERVLETPREKMHAALETGGVGVDMESAAIAEVAASAALPFVVLRVVVDGITDALPKHADTWVTPAGESRWLPFLGTLLFNPSQWGALALIARRYGTARRTLDRLAARLVPVAFEFSHRS